MTPEQEAVVVAVLKGRARDLPGLLTAVPDAQRRALLPELTKVRQSLKEPTRDLWGGLNASRTEVAVFVAGAACHTGAAAAAQWIAGGDPRFDAMSADLLRDALAGRDPEWLRQVAHRLADRRAVVEGMYEVVEGLARLSGAAPATDAFVRMWMNRSRWGREGLLDRLRADSFTPVLVPRLFEIPGVGWVFNRRRDSGDWTHAVCRLTEEGVLDRAAMIDACVARLLRGEQSASLRGFLDLLEAFGPTEDELAARSPDWVRLACDAPSTVAGHAQDVLRRLAEAGRLETALLVEASQGVLFRTEKKLLRGQLTLLDKALRRDGGAAPELLPVVAEAFGHEDVDVQERALKLAVRHTGLVDASVRAGLAAAAVSLPSVLRGRAAEVFGAPSEPPEPPELSELSGLSEEVWGLSGLSELPDEEPYAETLPPVQEPQRIPPPPATVEELVEEAGALLGRRITSVAHFERTLDGLVRHAHRDRDALAEALRPVVRRNYAWIEDRQFRPGAQGFDFLVAVVIGAVRATPGDSTLLLGDPRHVADDLCSHAAFEAVADVRVREVALSLLRDAAPPFLLATPDTTAGRLAPGVLLERLREYRRLGVSAGTYDFDQALLRVRPDPACRAAAAALGTPEGDRLAAWHCSGGLSAPAIRRVVSGTGDSARILVAVGEQPLLDDSFSPPFRRLRWKVACYHWWAAAAPLWLAVLPGQREFTAAQMLPLLSGCAHDDRRGTARALPLLAEAEAETEGPAGLAVHLVLAYGLGARHAEDRLSCVDALLTLAGRGQLDAALLGRELGKLVVMGAVAPGRLDDSLRTAARTGAYRTVWSVLAALLPGVLRSGEKPRGLGSLLALAAECAERCGERGGERAGIPGLDEVIARGGSTQLVKQARRLRESLA